MNLPDREQRVKRAAQDWMDNARRLRNSWLRQYAQKRGLTEREYLRMVIDVDIEADSNGDLPGYREQIESDYRKWFEFTDKIGSDQTEL